MLKSPAAQFWEWHFFLCLPEIGCQKFYKRAVIHSAKEPLPWLLNIFHKIYVCFCWTCFMDNCKMSVGKSYRACYSEELSHCYPWSANEVKMCWMFILSWGFTYYACYRCTMLICFLGKLCSICIILTSWNLQTSGKSVCVSLPVALSHWISKNQYKLSEPEGSPAGVLCLLNYRIKALRCSSPGPLSIPT